MNEKNNSLIDRFVEKYSFLNNFYLSSLWVDNIKYPSAEHAYQASKTEDIDVKNKISECLTPFIAKKMGKTIQLPENWDILKVCNMKKVLICKFENPFLFSMLQETKGKELIHKNFFNDSFWGVYKETGQNMLGKILMEIREGTFYE